MLNEDLNHTIDFWITELDQYKFSQLCAKPSANSWSIGQVYMHLIDDTNYYIEQIKTCLSVNEHAVGEAAPDAKIMFLNNEFPDEILEGAPANSCMAQPESKNQLRNDLLNIKVEMNKLWKLIEENSPKGKTEHPGLGFFGAREWFQFADMHFRHHMRQKKRIDSFLKEMHNS
jgi:hypothetical protein